jgi:hypothetical protein
MRWNAHEGGAETISPKRYPCVTEREKGSGWRTILKYTKLEHNAH